MAFVQGIPIRAGGATAVVMVFTFRRSRLLLFTLAISMTVDPGDVKGMVIAASKFLAARMVEQSGHGDADEQVFLAQRRVPLRRGVGGLNF